MPSSPRSSFAPAKINLFLHVTGKRADGYHLLDSLVAFTEFGDHIEVEAAEELSLHVTGALDVPREQNLVWKAAKALQATLPQARGARITLHKHIPVGAGLGGGSADTAAALRALGALWKAEVPPALALSLGSDVPVCMESVPAFMRGVGEKLTPVSLRAGFAVLLVNPNIPLATADVFRAFAGAAKQEIPFRQEIAETELLDMMRDTSNMLQAAAIVCLPVVGDVLEALGVTKDCLVARMSGSGATCFGLYATHAQAMAAHNALRAQYPHWWYQVTSLRGVHG